MPFVRPILPELRNRIRQDFAARLPGADALLRESNLRVVADVLAELSNAQFDYEDWLALQLFPDTAEAIYLERLASIWGVPREPATEATGALAVTGAANAVVPVTAEWMRADRVAVAAREAISLDAAGSGIVPVTAVLAGAAGNADPGTEVSMITTAPGVDMRATVAEPGLAGGADLESDEHLRMRLLMRIQFPPAGGSATDFIAWALEVPGVTRAWVYPLEQGPGTVVVRFMMDDVRAAQDGIPTPADVALVQAHLAQLRPVPALLAVMAPIPKPIDVVVQALTPDTPAVRVAAQAELRATFHRNAVPGQTTFVSWLWEAVSAAAGERHHTIYQPPGNVPAGLRGIGMLGPVD